MQIGDLKYMKNIFAKLSMACFATVFVTVLLTGCYRQMIYTPTVGQQLVDLQKAEQAGSLTEAEYQTQKTKVLNGK